MNQTMKRIFFTGLLLLAVWAASGAEVCKSTMLYAAKGDANLYLDRYTSVQAPHGKRPCLLFLFGGGFTGGNRDAEKYTDFFNYMAGRGVDVVSIDYRLGLRDASPTDFASPELFARKLISAIRMAVDDLYSATAFVLNRAEAWGIDPERIVICGSSAGAITVLQGEYALCNGDPNARILPDGFRYAGVISLAGAIFQPGEELVWGEKPAPMLLFHGDADSNVPYDALRVPGAGFFGSKHIAEQLKKLPSPFVFYSVEGAAHEMAEEPLNDNRSEICSFLRNLVYDRKPLMIETEVEVIGRPETNTRFTLEDYIRSNFAGE